MGLLVFLLLLVAQQATPGECTDEDYVLGGSPVPDGATGRFEWLVGLENRYGEPICAGALIPNGRIATSEHCLRLHITHNPLYAVFRKKTEDGPGERRQIDHYFTPINSGLLDAETGEAQYKQMPNKSDYAEAVFKGDAPAGISPIEICSLDYQQLQNGTKVKLIGWGNEGVPDKDDSRLLNEVDLKLALDGDTNFIYIDTVYDGVVKTHCSGDSGGPLLFEPNESASFCLLGTVIGTYNTPDGTENGITLTQLCAGNVSDTTVISNEKHKAFYNFVPGMTKQLTDSKKEFQCWTVSRGCSG